METTGMESLEIDRGALYSGQRPTAEETGAPRVISIREQVPERICNFTVNDPLLEVRVKRVLCNVESYLEVTSIQI